MNVRKTIPTTISIVVLIVGPLLLGPSLFRYIPREIWHTIQERLTLVTKLGDFHSSLLGTALWLVIIGGIINAILRKRAAITLALSLNIPIVLGSLFVVFMIIPLRPLIFLGLVYMIDIIGIYLTFQMTISNNQPSKNTIMSFIKGIRKGVCGGTGHIIDRSVVIVMSLLLVVFHVLLIIDFAIFAYKNWNRFI